MSEKIKEDTKEAVVATLERYQRLYGDMVTSLDKKKFIPELEAIDRELSDLDPTLKDRLEEEVREERHPETDESHLMILQRALTAECQKYNVVLVSLPRQ